MANPRHKSRKVQGYPVQPCDPQKRPDAADSPVTGGDDSATQANDAESQPPDPSRSTAIWLCVTLLNLVLLVFLIPESLLKDAKVEFLVKAVPVAAGLFLAGYVYIKAHFLEFLAKRSYKITQTAILGILILLHASQLPIIQINPQLEPADALLAIDGSEPEAYDGSGFRVSVNDHTVRIVKTTFKQVTIERTIKTSYKKILAAIFRSYSPHWPLLYQVAVDIQQPGVEVRIRKTDGEFDEDFCSKAHVTARNLPLTLDHNSRDTLIYNSGNDETVPDDTLELPYGEYVVNATRALCKVAYKEIKISIGKDDALKPEIGYPPCEAEP